MLLALEGVAKSYGPVRVLEPLSLTVGDGEFLTLLGPSGSGKTTVLRLIGGFTRPTEGRIRFDGADITDTPTHRRPFNTVFQDYALFPQMTVADNTAYGLMVRGMARAGRRTRAAEVLEVVGLSTMLDRYPSQLSGGQRQRVALARAIVCEPRLILLDEPLAALDAAMRRQMQSFLKQLQRRIRTTFVFVTHDQEEAITLSDRIVVMNAGRIEQDGTPETLYYAPRTGFVAGFFGDNNFLHGTATGATVTTPFGDVRVTAPAGPVQLAVRPERVRLGDAATDDAIAIPATVTEIAFVGPITQLSLQPDNAPGLLLTAKRTSDPSVVPLAVGDRVTARVAAGDIAVLPG